MTKIIIALTLMLSSLSSFAARDTGVKISSKVIDGISVTRVYNPSIFAAVCRGEIRVVTADDEVVVREVKKLVLGGDKEERLTVALDQEIVKSEAILECYN